MVFAAAAGELGGGRARASGVARVGGRACFAGSFDSGGPCGARWVGKRDSDWGGRARQQRQGQGQLFRPLWCGDEMAPTFFPKNSLHERKVTTVLVGHSITVTVCNALMGDF